MNGSFIGGCEDGEKFAFVFCTHREGLYLGFQVQWYFDLVRILETCQLFYLRENVWETPLTKQLPYQGEVLLNVSASTSAKL